MSKLFPALGVLSVAWAALLSIGCGQEAPPDRNTVASPKASSNEATTPANIHRSLKPDESRLAVVKYDRLIEAVKAYRGKVLIVDIWAEY